MFNLTTFRRSLLALALGACSALASAGTLNVELDTSNFAAFGSNGYIDLSFAGSPLNTVSSVADLSHFVGFGSSADAQVSGGVSGSLSGGYHIANNAGEYNDLFHAVNFGGKVSFSVTFSGDADPTGLYGSIFSVGLYDTTGTTALGGSTSVDGSLLHLNWTPSSVIGGKGGVSADIFAPGVQVLAAVPEPTTWAMLGAGLALVGLARRKNSQGQAQRLLPA